MIFSGAKITPPAAWLAGRWVIVNPSLVPANTPRVVMPAACLSAAPVTPTPPMRNASVNSGISTVAYGSLQARRAVSAHVLRIPSPSGLGTVSPALVSPPWNPPFRGAPFYSGNPPRGETHPGDTARLSSCCSVAALHIRLSSGTPTIIGARNQVCCLGGRHHAAA